MFIEMCGKWTEKLRVYPMSESMIYWLMDGKITMCESMISLIFSFYVNYSIKAFHYKEIF